MQIPLLRLKCGKLGNESAAARFAAATAPSDEFSIQDDKPYAELWMGTHPSLPSTDLTTSRSLLDIVSENTALLSPEIAAKYSNRLPFLFKILSIRKALSIQAHPNKGLAAKLHAKDPKNYPDDNHKPEMAIAVTDFEGLCGFRPLAEIKGFLGSVDALRELIGEDAATEFEKTVVLKKEGEEETEDEMKTNKSALRTLFTKLMSSSPSAIENATSSLLASFDNNASSLPSDFVALIRRLNGQFPNDIGLFVLFFLNFLRLSPGEAVFLKADDIHAYISGDIVECMASSDNVVRAGFTPKFKDVDTLTSMLTYSYAPIEEQKMTAVEYPYATLNTKAYSSGSEVMLYDPPIEEFSVVRTDLNTAGAKVTFEGLNGPSVVICTGGKGKISVGPAKTEEVREGYVFFVGAGAECVLESEGEGEKFTTFKAFCEVDRE
ncbi:mannose-6-phosphate isomerase [Ascosphaera apis ARSEF 7405]|uniref:Mannose-6-phosphate isomerase n=1 Tax=Ascosphaera apis ARSEF 7405 TaxID=392613 RepID=A0A167XRF9_9EURO|nr:mannose-6-phosphate isomerase [Ascosphaera apis ARSEF 7405]